MVMVMVMVDYGYVTTPKTTSIWYFKVQTIYWLVS